MKNKKYSILLLALFVANVTFAQEETIAPDAPPADTANLPIVDTDAQAEGMAGAPFVADEKITTILLENFEIPQGWLSSIPIDFGVSRILYRDGSPEEIASDENKTVLGVKTIFFRRNYGWMSIDRPFPMYIRNIVRNFSMWVSGRDKRHNIFVKVRDIYGNRLNISGGDMRFRGWKNVIFSVGAAVVQYDPIYTAKGLEFLGFHISFVAEDIATSEPYYVYFDYLTAGVNMVAETVDSDDIADDW